MATNALKVERLYSSALRRKPLYCWHTPEECHFINGYSQDNLQRYEKGQFKYETFVGERILATETSIYSATSIWDPIKKLKLTTHSTWMAKQNVRVGDKKIKLREERQLLARFFVIQQFRPELVPKLPDTIGDYEMSVVPRPMFANDGSLLIPTDKSSIMHAVKSLGDVVDEPADNRMKCLLGCQKRITHVLNPP